MSHTRTCQPAQITGTQLPDDLNQALVLKVLATFTRIGYRHFRGLGSL